MNIKQLPRSILNQSMKYVSRSKDWKTDRKIVVIESDDWGSIRMPSRKVYEQLLRIGIRVDLSHYNRYDSMASETDFSALYEVLRRHNDKNGRNPIITGNCIVANPDFEKIRESDFSEYYFEPFINTLQRYPNHNVEIWEDGIKEMLFHPQFHGREHLNVRRWMTYLKQNSPEARLAFDYSFFGIGSKISLEGNPSFLQAFDSNDYLEHSSLSNILSSGIGVFKNIFKFSPKSFIAPNYTWNQDVEDELFKYNVEYFQGGRIQKVTGGGTNFKFTGKSNLNNQIYLVRNVVFEPSSSESKDWIGSCLGEINRAFKQKNPAIICSHRVNFIGEIFEDNRKRNLCMLDTLLTKLLKTWPEVEFLTSDQLGEIIKEDLKK